MRTYPGARWYLVALLFFLVATPALAWAEGEGAPSILLEEIRYDFGEVFEGAKVNHAFKVKNKGTADLEIKEVNPG